MKAAKSKTMSKLKQYKIKDKDLAEMLGLSDASFRNSTAKEKYREFAEQIILKVENSVIDFLKPSEPSKE